MRFIMDTDQVRVMAASIRQKADVFEEKMISVVTSVKGVSWQSQAREEFIVNLEALLKINANSLQAMRLIPKAAERKVDQWEAIANKFNGPFFPLEGVWNSFLDLLHNTWQGLLSMFGKIKLPSFPLLHLGFQHSQGLLLIISN